MLGLRRVAVVWVCVVVGGLVFGGASAWGALTYPFDGQLPQSGTLTGELSPGGVAVDDVNGNTYVAVSRNTQVVDVFDAAGAQLPPLDGSLTPAGSFGGELLRVAADDGSGRVYVLDSEHNVVDAFDASGGYVCQITGSASPSASECNGPAGSATPAGGFNQPTALTVDQATGRVYVVDSNNGVIDVFSSAGAYVTQILLSSIPGGFSAFLTRGVAVDDFNGEVFLSDSSSDAVQVFNGAGEYVTTWTGSNTPQGNFQGEISVAADNASGEVFVSNSFGQTVVDVFAPTGEYLRRLTHSFVRPQNVAVDEGSGRVYVSDSEEHAFTPTTSVVYVFDPVAVLPDVTSEAASGVGPTTATLNGSVNPSGVQLSDCHFDYGPSAAYGQIAACVPGAASIPADEASHAVSAALTELEPGTTYHFRLVASNANCAHCTMRGEDLVFQTPPRPSIDGVASANITGSGADLSARIDPNGYDTTYRFEYGTSTAYGSSLPVPDGDVGAGSEGVAVGVHLSGLNAGTTYHWRVVATSANGTTVTGDQTFVYATSGGGLPDGRAYEMVTPAQKGGAWIDQLNFGTRPSLAEDGSRVLDGIDQCFGAAVSCQAARIGVGTVYSFTRTTGGWVASPLAPSARVFDANSALVTRANTGLVLFGAPTPPGGEDDLYARQPDGSFVDVGPVTPPAGGPQGNSSLSSPRATDDLSRVVFGESGSVWSFPGMLPGSAYVFEYVGGGNSQPVPVSVTGGAGSTSLVSQCGAELGGGFGALSVDGRTVFFTALKGVSGACEGPAADEVLARIDESRTVLLSGRSPAGCTTVACLGSPAGDAQFEGASSDGSRAFFTSTQQLTDGASEDRGDTAYESGCAEAQSPNGCNLYEYDLSLPAGHNLIDVSAGDTSGEGPRVQHVVASSSDGSHVYFLARGVLSAAANELGQRARSGAENLYVFERDAAYPEGHVAFVAAIPDTLRERSAWEQTDQDASFMENVSPDGRFLVFTSTGRLTGDDSSTTGARQVFRYDAATGQLIRISIGERGFNDNGNDNPLDANVAHVSTLGASGGVRRDATMSNDGSFVFFESPVALTPGALNDVQIGFDFTGTGARAYAENVYEWHEGHVYLISGGQDTANSYSAYCGTASAVCLLGTDATGSNVFFTSAQSLVAQDADTQLDVYDARICTQSSPCIPAPASSAALCQGEACYAAPTGAPAALSAASSASGGAGNLQPQNGAVKAKAKRKVKPKHRRRGRRRRGRRARLAGGRARNTNAGGGK